MRWRASSSPTTSLWTIPAGSFRTSWSSASQAAGRSRLSFTKIHRGINSFFSLVYSSEIPSLGWSRIREFIADIDLNSKPINMLLAVLGISRDKKEKFEHNCWDEARLFCYHQSPEILWESRTVKISQWGADVTRSDKSEASILSSSECPVTTRSQDVWPEPTGVKRTWTCQVIT